MSRITFALTKETEWLREAIETVRQNNLREHPGVTQSEIIRELLVRGLRHHKPEKTPEELERERKTANGFDDTPQRIAAFMGW